MYSMMHILYGSYSYMYILHCTQYYTVVCIVMCTTLKLLMVSGASKNEE